jgi:hypothetical protein
LSAHGRWIPINERPKPSSRRGNLLISSSPADRFLLWQSQGFQRRRPKGHRPTDHPEDRPQNARRPVLGPRNNTPYAPCADQFPGWRPPERAGVPVPLRREPEHDNAPTLAICDFMQQINELVVKHFQQAKT